MPPKTHKIRFVSQQTTDTQTHQSTPGANTPQTATAHPTGWDKGTQTYTLGDDELEPPTPSPVYRHFSIPPMAPALMALEQPIVVPTLPNHGFVHNYATHMAPNSMTALRFSDNGCVQHWAYAGEDRVAHLVMIAPVSHLQAMYTALHDEQANQSKS